MKTEDEIIELYARTIRDAWTDFHELRIKLNKQMEEEINELRNKKSTK